MTENQVRNFRKTVAKTVAKSFDPEIVEVFLDSQEEFEHVKTEVDGVAELSPADFEFSERDN